jgi:hypothetical protein
MADYAPNFTARYKLIYSVAGLQHSLGLRYAASMPQSGVVAAAESLLNSIFSALGSILLSSFTLIDAEYSAANSTFFVPIGLGSLTVTGSVAAGIFPMDEIVTTTWAGRSIGGHKGRFVLFGVYWGVGNADFDDFVVTSTEEPAIGTVAGLLSSDPGLVANDNQAAPFWRPRATIKVNDAWVDNRRP